VVINHSVLEPKRVADVSDDEMKHIYDVNVFSGFAVVGFKPVLSCPEPLLKERITGQG
jgi:hypothetical protein